MAVRKRRQKKGGGALEAVGWPRLSVAGGDIEKKDREVALDPLSLAGEAFEGVCGRGDTDGFDDGK